MAFQLISDLLPPTLATHQRGLLNMWLPNWETCDGSYLVILLSACLVWFKVSSVGILSSNKTSLNWHNKTYTRNRKKIYKGKTSFEGAWSSNLLLSKLNSCHLRACSVHQLPGDTAQATPGYFCCGHKKAANICGLTVPSQINRYKQEDWILFEAPSKAPSGLTSCVWVISQSLNPSLQPDTLDMLIGLHVTILSYMYQGPYM